MAILALEDSTVFHGKGFGASATSCGEVCFNTSMTGYQEILTDPSYKGQIVTMTYPEIEIAASTRRISNPTSHTYPVLLCANCRRSSATGARANH